MVDKKAMSKEEFNNLITGSKDFCAAPIEECPSLNEIFHLRKCDIHREEYLKQYITIDEAMEAIDNATIKLGSSNWESEFTELCKKHCVNYAAILPYISQLLANTKAETIREILAVLNDRELDMTQDDFRTGFRYAMTYIEKAIKEG